jgi:hypothetical protein
MIKSNFSRAKRREFVKFYKQRLKNTGCHYICRAADAAWEFQLGRDVLKCVEHTLSRSDCNTVPSVFHIHGAEERQQFRNKWLRIYAEQGVAYHWQDTDQPYTK